MAFLQGFAPTTAFSTSPTVIAFTGSTTAGSMQCIAIVTNPPTLSISGITDTQNSTWVILPTFTYDAAALGLIFVYALNTTGGSANSISISWTGTITSVLMAIGEYSGVTGLRNSTTGTTGTSTSLLSNSANSFVNDLLVGFFGAHALTAALTGTGNTPNIRESIFASAANVYGGFGDGTSSGGSVTATATANASTTWGAQLLVFSTTSSINPNNAAANTMRIMSLTNPTAQLSQV